MSSQQRRYQAGSSSTAPPAAPGQSKDSNLSATNLQHAHILLPTVTVFPKLSVQDDDSIIVTVGEGAVFYTTVGTLITGSGWFEGKLSGRLAPVPRTEEGILHVFVDVDAEVFPHILQFLRCGRMPLLFDETTRKYDIKMYMRILDQAQFLIIRDMEKWILRRRYKHVVTFKRRARIETGAWDSDGMGNDNLDTNGTTSLSMQTDWVEERHYPCPNSRHATRFNRFPCKQRTCAKARGREEPIWEMVKRPKMTTVREKITYHFERLDPAWKPPRLTLPPGAQMDWSSADIHRDISDDEENDSESEDDNNNGNDDGAWYRGGL